MGARWNCMTDHRIRLFSRKEKIQMITISICICNNPLFLRSAWSRCIQRNADLNQPQFFLISFNKYTINLIRRCAQSSVAEIKWKKNSVSISSELNDELLVSWTRVMCDSSSLWWGGRQCKWKFLSLGGGGGAPSRYPSGLFSGIKRNPVHHQARQVVDEHAGRLFRNSRRTALTSSFLYLLEVLIYRFTFQIAKRYF